VTRPQLECLATCAENTLNLSLEAARHSRVAGPMQYWTEKPKVRALFPPTLVGQGRWLGYGRSKAVKRVDRITERLLAMDDAGFSFGGKRGRSP
jgi:hypothetical protein